jgi:hypothetical protein
MVLAAAREAQGTDWHLRGVAGITSRIVAAPLTDDAR